MIQLAEIFQNGMTLQQGKPLRLWGKTDAAQTIDVLWNGEPLLHTELTQGDLALTLPALPAQENGTLTLQGTADTLIFTDVDVGEVWIAGGQSNMEFLLKYDEHGDETAAVADDAHFRFYDVGEYAYPGQRESGQKDGSRWDKWLPFTPENAPYFSAVGTYFALKLRRALGVPVAVVGCNWGGTSASAWVDEARLKADPALRVYTDEYARATAKLDLGKYTAAHTKPNTYAANPKVIAETEKRMKNEITRKPGLLTKIVGKIIVSTYQMGPCDENRPGGLYTMMLQTIVGYTAAGVLWYQGETDHKHAEIYDILLKTLIDNWRTDWGAALPFLLVQLAPYEGWKECSGENYEIVREKQQQVADTEPGVYMVSIMDVGSRYDIHPKQKRPVGERLADKALAKIYGQNVPCDAPRMVSAKRAGGGIVCRFVHAEQGLHTQEPRCHDSDLAGLFCVQAGACRLPVTAAVQGDTVLLTGPELQKRKELTVSFAYRPYAPMVLYAGGLPAAPCAPIQVEE